MAGDVDYAIDAALPTVLAFSGEFGEGHALLAMHAALPLGLTPELVHLIRTNFVPDVPWIAEVDLLLSPLCRAVGTGIWEIEPEIRDLLLEELRLDAEFGPAQLERVARFVHGYCSLAANRPSSRLMREFHRAQRIVSLAYFAPDLAGRELAQALAGGVDAEGGPGALRVSKLVRALGEPLYSQRELVVYAKGVGELLGGDTKQATRVFRSLGDFDEERSVAGITLPAPSELGVEPGSGAAIQDDGPPPTKPRCVVLTGMGTRTDFAQGRVFDLEASYREIVRPAVEDAGFDCTRADELDAAGVIGASLLVELLGADLVVADLSTLPASTMYELGVRHGLRPARTVVMAESGAKLPFDIEGPVVHRYESPVGEGEGEMAVRAREELRARLVELRTSDVPDSPPYLYLPELVPPRVATEEDTDESPEVAAAADPPVGGSSTGPRTCFALMASGRKTDFEQGRTIDLDKTYRQIVMPAADAATLACTRVDGLAYSGAIEARVYERLLRADVVIADLSTSNPHVMYELGLRHALRPHTTIVIAEREMIVPFDANAFRIHRYEHQGDWIGDEEAERMQRELTSALLQAVERTEVDSPIYRLVPGLRSASLPEPGTDVESGPAAYSPEAIGLVLDRAREARDAGEWTTARSLLEPLVHEQGVSDPEVVRQLALATYKSRDPDVETALQEARSTLSRLDPDSSRDPDTLLLWGAIHKEFWEEQNERGAIERAVWAYEAAFDIRPRGADGITLAFLLDALSQRSGPEAGPPHAAHAREIRLKVIEMVEPKIEQVRARKHVNEEELFWLRATLAEALLGTGQRERSEAMLDVARAEAPEEWMTATLDEQLRKLEELLAPDTASPVATPSVFVSYGRAVTEFAEKLQVGLERAGVRCWSSVPGGPPPGDEMPEATLQGIERADHVLLCCSEFSLASFWVRREMRVALEKEQRSGVPALIPLDLDGYLRHAGPEELRSRQAVEFHRWQDDKRFERSLELLTGVMRRIAETEWASTGEPEFAEQSADESDDSAGETPSPWVCISYRRDHSGSWAHRLQHGLRSRLGPESVLVDVEDFEIRYSAVGRANAMVVVIGPRWMELFDRKGRRSIDEESESVRTEIRFALERAMLVIPVLVDGADMPRADDLPEDIAPLAERQAFVLNEKSFHSDLSDLIGFLEGSDRRS